MKPGSIPLSAVHPSLKDWGVIVQAIEATHMKYCSILHQHYQTFVLADAEVIYIQVFLLPSNHQTNFNTI